MLPVALHAVSTRNELSVQEWLGKSKQRETGMPNSAARNLMEMNGFECVGECVLERGRERLL